MSLIIEPGHCILYMKVGTHAKEPLPSIIKRKTKEIEDTGYAFWGYGGPTCHPRTMVQPFGQESERRGSVIYLCMEPMESTHFADQIRADEFSVDGFVWEAIPQSIGALGSRYALIISSLSEEEFELPLSRTKVALGNSAGILGSTYIKGRVDKACLEIINETPPGSDPRKVDISLVAQLKKPYAVFLRNRRMP